MRNNILIFFISLLVGLLILFFRVNYENKTGESKSCWNITELKEGDSKNFFDRGLAISQGKQYYSGCENAPIVAFFRPPVYPLFLAVSFLVFGISFKVIIILQIIIASLCVLFISKITDLLFGKKISITAAVLANFYYPMWNDAMIINSELLSMFLGLAALYYLIKIYTQKNIRITPIIISGMLAGLASLTRGQFFFYSLLLIIFIFASTGKNKITGLKYSVYWFASCLIPVISWTIYAYASAGIFIFISSQGALSIWWGWSPLVVLEEQYPIWNNLWDKSFIRDDMIGEYLPVKSTSWFLNEAYSFIVKYPVDSLKIAYYKLLDSWGFISIYSDGSLFGKILKILKLNWDLFLAVPGFVFLWKQKSRKVFGVYVLSACLIFTAVSILTAGLVRYRIPYLDPLLIIFASVTVQKIYSNFLSRKTKA